MPKVNSPGANLNAGVKRRQWRGSGFAEGKEVPRNAVKRVQAAPQGRRAWMPGGNPDRAFGLCLRHKEQDCPGLRRGAGVVERARLESECTVLSRTEGSNPSLSAIYLIKSISYH